MDDVLRGTHAKFFTPTGTDVPEFGMYAVSDTELGFSVGGVKVSGIGTTAANQPSARLVATGGIPVSAAADGTDTTPVVTETYIGEVLIVAPMSVTGFSLFNGTAVAGNVVVALYNKAGVKVANSALAGTAQAGIDTLQRIPFTAAYAASPGTYYVGAQFNNVGARFNTHPFGDFGASKKTGEVFGTLTTITPPTTFTADLAPMGSLY